MAAVVLESLSVPRFNSSSIAASSPRAATRSLAAVGERGLGFLSEFSGLRISRRIQRVVWAVGPSSRHLFGRRGSVVCEAQDTAIDVRDVTKDTWKSLVVECDKPVLVEFWAPWCGPCKLILPTIGKLSKTYEGKLECYKLNTDENPDIATQYGIRSIPTIMIFKNGEKKEAVIGAVPESTLITSIEKFVSMANSFMEVESGHNGYVNDPFEEPHIEQDPLKKSIGSTETPTPQPSVSASGCFDCNICLDFAVDPVVTLCGHLYCWPCIYKWLEMDNSDSSHHCPVCKASLSQDSLVPLYGRGHNTKTNSPQTFNIPQRPSSSVHHHRGQTEIESESLISDDEENRNPVNRHQHYHYHVHQHEHHHHYPSSSMNRVIHSTAGGVLGGMAIAVLPWVFRNHQEAAASLYYVGGSGGSLRQRRQEMEVKSSLHQIWVFLFCCAMLCLLLF